MQRISKVFHQIWLGPNDPPAESEGFRETWLRHHPDWEVRVWGDDDFGWLKNQALFKRAPSYTQKVDIAKYELINRHGGVYLDFDLECLKPITDLCEGVDVFAGWEPDGGINVAIFGATPRHRFLRQVVATMPVWCLIHGNDRVDIQTGPELFTHVATRRGWTDRRDVAFFPTHYFYPYNWNEWPRPEGPFPDSYAVHHCDLSGQGAPGLPGRLSDLLPGSLLKARMAASTLVWTARTGIKRRTE